jgi:hypothetical protein
MFVYCEKCDWSQDDFWDRRYNPIKFLQDDEEYLFNPLDNFMIFKYIGKGESFRKYLIKSLKSVITKIECQHWSTKEEYDKSDKKCPKCGSNLIED